MTRWRGESRNFSLEIRVAEGVQPTRLATEWRGNAVAAPLFAVRAAAQGDVILRGSGE